MQILFLACTEFNMFKICQIKETVSIILSYFPFKEQGGFPIHNGNVTVNSYFLKVAEN